MKNKSNVLIYLCLILGMGVVLSSIDGCKKQDITVQKTPVVTWASPADLTAGSTLTLVQLNASADVPGTFNYTPALNSIVSEGNDQVLTVTFTPTDLTNYKSVSQSVKINVKAAPVITKKIPVITWANPADLGAGSVLTDTQLNAAADVAGTYVYLPAIGTAMVVGNSQVLKVTFTPTDAVNYETVSKTVVINITTAIVKKTPVITWAAPADLVAGSNLSAAQLNAAADVAGTFVYSPTTGTVMSAGNSQALKVTFTPTDAVNYTTVSKTVTINITAVIVKKTPVITWANPADLIAGSSLSATQLNATADVAGTFVYSPAIGTVMSAGNSQALKVTFTPTDGVNYTTASKTVTINITAVIVKKIPVITWATPADLVEGSSLSITQLNATADVAGSFVYSPTTGTVMSAGNSQALKVTFTPTDNVNYTTISKTIYINITAAIVKTYPIITWVPSDLFYKDVVGLMQLNAVANVPGEFEYMPYRGGEKLTVGEYELNVDFYPNDTLLYKVVSKTVTIKVYDNTQY